MWNKYLDKTAKIILFPIILQLTPVAFVKKFIPNP